MKYENESAPEATPAPEGEATPEATPTPELVETQPITVPPEIAAAVEQQRAEQSAQAEEFAEDARRIASSINASAVAAGVPTSAPVPAHKMQGDHGGRSGLGVHESSDPIDPSKVLGHPTNPFTKR